MPRSKSPAAPYRSGENEYYINGNRVRLRDVAELLGSSGLSERTYTVIGQGLVDQALSLRPEERRKLFEEAAGITVHQAKRDHASTRLADSQNNLARARDIISELTPRLRYLKGQARRAQEYQQLKADLESQLKTWYGYRWRQALLALAGARNRAVDAAAAAEEETGELNALLEQVAARREERGRLRDELSDWHRSSSALHRQAETVQRELAVRTEQVRLWREQGDDLGRELTYLAAALEDGKARLQGAKAEFGQAQGEHATQARRVEEAQADLQRRERERAGQARVLAQAEEALLGLRTQLAERRSRLAQIGDRRTELAGANSEQVNAGKAAAAQVAEFEGQLKTLGAKADEFSQALASIEKDRQARGLALATAQEAERKAQEQLNAAQRAVARLQDQQDMLERLRDEGAGLGGGARAVMAVARADNKSGYTEKPGFVGAGNLVVWGAKPGASRVEHLDGILGPLGELIQVPPEYERAMEAALGGRMQDVVVRGWEDAEAAVEFLKRNQAGRATFLPLDTLRPGRAADVPKGPGIIGLASDLVGFDPEIRAAVELALNHTVVVQDLPTARRLINRGGGATLVTLDGEIVRASGSVTGGAENRQRDSGMLQRARQLRELPEQVQAAAAVVAGHEKQIAGLRKTQAEARTALDALRARRDELNASQARLNTELSKTQLAVERAKQTVGWHEERRKGLEREAGELDRREVDLKAAIADLAAQIEKREAAVEAERRRLNELSAEDYVAELARLKAEAAVSAGQLRSLEGRVRELQASQASREQEIQSKTARRTALGNQQAEASKVIEEQSAVAERLAGEIGELTACIDPAEARLAELEKSSRESETQERQLREQLRLAQARQNQADMLAQRSQDELAHLRGEIEKDLGLVELTQFVDDSGASQEALAEELIDTQPPLPLNGMVTRLPVVVELPEGLDADVRNLRGQMARLGPVNLDALAEYQEVETRYNFLTTQSADLEHAVASLQEVIAELDRVMEREFVATFKAVAARSRMSS